ncbi:hypothetical protein Tco_0637426 [Tanacetum coccineum]
MARSAWFTLALGLAQQKSTSHYTHDFKGQSPKSGCKELAPVIKLLLRFQNASTFLREDKRSFVVQGKEGLGPGILENPGIPSRNLMAKDYASLTIKWHFNPNLALRLVSSHLLELLSKWERQEEKESPKTTKYPWKTSWVSQYIVKDCNHTPLERAGLFVHVNYIKARAVSQEKVIPTDWENPGSANLRRQVQESSGFCGQSWELSSFQMERAITVILRTEIGPRLSISFKYRINHTVSNGVDRRETSEVEAAVIQIGGLVTPGVEDLELGLCDNVSLGCCSTIDVASGGLSSILECYQVDAILKTHDDAASPKKIIELRSHARK